MRERAIAYVVLVVLAAAVWIGLTSHRAVAAAGELRALRARAATLDARRLAVQAERTAEMDRRAAAGLEADVPPTPALSHEQAVELSGLRQRIAVLEEAAGPGPARCH